MQLQRVDLGPVLDAFVVTWTGTLSDVASCTIESVPGAARPWPSWWLPRKRSSPARSINAKHTYAARAVLPTHLQEKSPTSVVHDDTMLTRAVRSTAW